MHSSVDYRVVKQLMNEMQHSQMVKSLFPMWSRAFFQCSQTFKSLFAMRSSGQEAVVWLPLVVSP